MRQKSRLENGTDYFLVISEMGIDPLRAIRAGFATGGLIPLLALFYVIFAGSLSSDLFCGTNGIVLGASMIVLLAGYLYIRVTVGTLSEKIAEYSARSRGANNNQMDALAKVSHDLKTPLTVIKVGMGDLIDGINGVLNDSQKEVAEICLRSVNKMNIFINDILASYKERSIGMESNREAIDFKKVVENEVKEVSALARKKNQNINFRVSPGDLVIWADQQKVSRAVMNLLSNAIKYTPDGGMIDIDVFETKGKSVQFKVVNTGFGIFPDELDKVLMKNVRLPRHLGTEGTGLGLSIVKDIVNLHKGRLAVSSVPGKSTEFSIYLPRDLRGRKRQYQD